MRLTYSFRIDKNDKVYSILKGMSRVSKDLYNQALFEVNKHYEETGKTLSYVEIDRIMKTKTNLDGKINYQLLPAQVAQQTLMLVDQNIRSFFKALADYKEHPQKYQIKPRFPGFLPKDGHFILIFTNQKASIKPSGTIQLMKDVVISIPEMEFEKYKAHFILFRQVRIVPKFNGLFFNIEIIYEEEELNSKVDINRVASLDLGVNNLITFVDNLMGEENRAPIIINGRPIKSINQFYNKKRAEIQAFLSMRRGESPQKFIASSRSSNGQKKSKELMKITDWRNEKIKDYMHKTSRFVINYCLEHKIGHIVIGKNSGWKQEINIGSRNNQNFVAIPFELLIQQIQYKAQLVGIKVTIIEESYTSKCSAMDLEAIGKHEDHAYAGKRVKRGLFKSAIGFLINADVNGALNTLRKIIGDNFLKSFIQKVAWLIPSSGYLCYPFKVCF
ncbi:IS200/IS605 family element transposase accessory protein TnpB [Candidatus Poribacteria bacterium]|nr:IS200/IS605 family element transposase accessory protein TnpB [Candidatus Poribacteria bacterium]